MYDPEHAMNTSTMFYKEYDAVGEEWNIYEVDGEVSDGIVHDNLLATCLTEPEADRVLYALVFCYEEVRS